ncbi:MAG: protein-L-isoaspartate(D-aspartate) O-methyltransferase [Acholeplasmatales bacterium]|nr:MAG: protein-L-isoaspartate(D-aspartate) O-methyltransferase [Acholeplasmatales bacterium]
MSHDYDRKRADMLKHDIVGRGIRDQRVIAACAEIPRHDFVDADARHLAYEDAPLRIRHNQTISQPFIVAYMTEALALTGQERVLEIGTGSGYQTAILARCVNTVYTIERIDALLEDAKRILTTLGIHNIHYRVGDGKMGWESAAPFDAVMVTASADDIPDALLEQLKEGGRLVMPVGDDFAQELVRITRTEGEYVQEHLGGVRFVRLI